MVLAAFSKADGHLHRILSVSGGRLPGDYYSAGYDPLIVFEPDCNELLLPYLQAVQPDFDVCFGTTKFQEQWGRRGDPAVRGRRGMEALYSSTTRCSILYQICGLDRGSSGCGRGDGRGGRKSMAGFMRFAGAGIPALTCDEFLLSHRLSPGHPQSYPHIL